jgi:hypothetical protein
VVVVVAGGSSVDLHTIYESPGGCQQLKSIGGIIVRAAAFIPAFDFEFPNGPVVNVQRDGAGQMFRFYDVGDSFPRWNGRPFIRHWVIAPADR